MRSIWALQCTAPSIRIKVRPGPQQCESCGSLARCRAISKWVVLHVILASIYFAVEALYRYRDLFDVPGNWRLDKVRDIIAMLMSQENDFCNRDAIIIVHSVTQL